MKKFLAVAMYLLAFSIYAMDIPEGRRNEINAYLKSIGMPNVDSGFTLRKSQTNARLERPIRIKGFDNNVKQFLSFEQTAKNQYLTHKSDFNPHHSHLRQTLDELNSIMAYTFVGVPSSAITTLIGYAPSITYIKEKGWVGAVQFFKHDDLLCQFSENNIKLSHAAYNESDDKIGTEINGKYTMLTISGNKDSGFMYSVQWFDLNFFRTLECASIKDDSNIISEVIDMAKLTDLSQ